MPRWFAVGLLRILLYLDSTDVHESLFTRAWRWGELHRLDREHVDLDEPHERWGIRLLSPWHFDTALTFTRADATGDSLHRMLSHLHRLHLVSWDKNAASVSMEESVHQQLRSRLAHQDRAAAWAAAVTTLTLSTERDYGWRSFTQDLRPHIETCFELQPSNKQLLRNHGPDICRSYYTLWWQLVRAHSTRLGAVYERLEALLRSIQSPEDMVQSVNSLLMNRIRGDTLYETGDYESAIRVQREEFSLLQTLIGEDEIGTRAAHIRLIDSLNAAEHYDEALALSKDHMEREKRCAGGNPDAEGYLLSLHGLGLIYVHLGQYPEAIEILEDIVRIRERKSEPEGNFTSLMATRGVLAAAYRETGKTAQAVAMMEAIVEHDAKTLDPDCTLRLQSIFHLGSAYISNEQTEHAIELFQELVRIWSQLAPPASKRVLQAKHGLAKAHLYNGTPAVGIPLLEEVVEAKAEASGTDSRWTAISALIECCIRAKKYSKAKAWLERVRSTEADCWSAFHWERYEAFQARLLAIENQTPCNQDQSERVYGTIF